MEEEGLGSMEDFDLDETEYAPTDPLLSSLRRREKTRRRQKRQENSEQKRLSKIKAELRAKSSYSMPSYEELCQRYQETLSLCSASQSLFDLFSVEPLTSSLEGELQTDPVDSEESSEEELLHDSPSQIPSSTERKRKSCGPLVTEHAYKELLAQHKRERKLRRLTKDPKELRTKRKYEALLGLLDDEIVLSSFGKGTPPDVETLRKSFKKQKRIIRVDPAKYLFTTHEGANSYIDVFDDEYKAYDERRHSWQYEEEEGVDLQFVERLHRSRRSGNAPPSVATLSWAPDRENFNTIWMVIVKRDIPKAHRQYVSSHVTITGNCKRLASLCQKEARRKVALTMKLAREAQHRAKKIAREMTVYWRKYDKDEREAKKRREIEERKKRKEEEEIREANRQQRKLNYLLTQTELFSYFIAKKMEGATDLTPPPNVAASTSAAPARSAPEGMDDETLKEEAGRNALAALDRQADQMRAFDEDMRKLRAESQAMEVSSAAVETRHEKDMPIIQGSLQLPNLQEGEQDGGIKLVPVPRMFRGKLKQYQRKGLSWLVNLYEQGINGILADEMGLGKTVQSISFLSYLAEVKNIWGPFLVLAPTSTLHNWQQEITKFCPLLKVLPYWGTAKDRKVIRKYWNPAHLYSKQSPFHVLITNYNLVVRDEKYFHRIKWEYMVLDEAQAIKSSSSSRWRSLLMFQCRNRLLLTGTPIQNSMAELWALLHFIMPTLFDSHQEFTEWFSKDIESHAENKSALNEHQLSRLHLILKPFMLRRMKQDVESEMPKKLEVEVMCRLSTRQKALYTAIKEKISVAELLSKSINSESDVDLMNLVMQFRKVCNHPELFERAEYRSPVVFSLHTGKANESPISFSMPRQVFDMELVQQQYCDLKRPASKFNIFEPFYVHRSLFPATGSTTSSAFSLLRFIGISPAELTKDILGRDIERWLTKRKDFKQHPLLEMPTSPHEMLLIRPISSRLLRPSSSSLVPLCILSPRDQYRRMRPLVQTVRCFVPPVAAGPEVLHVWGSRRAAWAQWDYVWNPRIYHLLTGLPPARTHKKTVLKTPEKGGGMLRDLDNLLDRRRLWVPDRGQLIADSGKLRVLDELLTRLKAEGHRVLCYSQMTKMIDILEDFMAFRKHRYIRLDGSSKLSERRDMVEDFQTNPNIFVFLLSTRAGGIGINLTSADTVIFYDSDWNPTNDAQAMDRAHRIGQTEQVTVYRLLTKDTIEERILHRAQEKNKIQALVITGGKFDRATLKPKEVVSLLDL